MGTDRVKVFEWTPLSVLIFSVNSYRPTPSGGTSIMILFWGDGGGKKFFKKVISFDHYFVQENAHFSLILLKVGGGLGGYFFGGRQCLLAHPWPLSCIHHDDSRSSSEDMVTYITYIVYKATWYKLVTYMHVFWNTVFFYSCIRIWELLIISIKMIWKTEIFEL